MLRTGDIVRVTEYGGRKLTRRVVDDRGASVVVCNEEEYVTAQAESRKPNGVGFPCEAVGILKERTSGN
ncbi:MAG: hypothetical protein ACRDF4_12065 [Rhabdochlamydiaceae bacterium]